MNSASSMMREWRYLRSDRRFLFWLIVAISLSTLSIASGLNEVEQQRQTITSLEQIDLEERLAAQAQQQDWGGLAYASFHLTYDAPSDFAFAALGVRDREPWKHRIRALALEGQIYERDTGNPVLALTGRFDFAFFAAFVIPLLIIVLFHDLKQGERNAGRYELLVATSGHASTPFRLRAILMAFLLYLAILVPLIVGSARSGTSSSTMLSAVLALGAYVLFWSSISYWFSQREANVSAILGALLGVWVLLAVVLPTSSKLMIDRAIPVPEGADIQTTQRESVNSAWDKPKEATMDVFAERHPEWAEMTQVAGTFEWKWYFAFHQVGDQEAESLSLAYRAGRQQRDQFANMAAWLSPPVLLERTFQSLANTDLEAAMAYEAKIRDFHGELRRFYYSKLFPNAPFETQALTAVPQFTGGAE